MSNSDLLLPILRAHLRHAFLFSLLLNALAVVPTLYLLQVYDRVLSSRSLETLGMLASFALIALGMGWAFEVVRARILSHAGASLERRLGQQLLISQLEDQARKPTNRHLHGLRDLAMVRSFLSGPAVCMLFDLPWTPVYLLLLFLFHWMLGLLALASALLLLALAVMHNRRTTATVSGYESQQRDVDRMMAQLVRNAEVIGALGMGKRMATLGKN